MITLYKSEDLRNKCQIYPTLQENLLVAKHQLTPCNSTENFSKTLTICYLLLKSSNSLAPATRFLWPPKV